MIECRVVTESGVKLILWLLGAAFVGATLATPQPVAPWEMPSLVLDRDDVLDSIRFDQALAGEASDSAEAVTLQSLFLEHGRAEADPPYAVQEYDRRQAAIHHAIEELIDAEGPAALDAQRAKAVDEFVDVFYETRGIPRNDYEVGVLGGFPVIAERYGLIVDGKIIAPELTVRSLYKGRWNAIHRRPLQDGFSQIELQAYWGWLALHGWGRPLPQRIDALVAFKEADGYGVNEAAALFDLLNGHPERAAKSLDALYQDLGELRLRNLSMGASHAALLSSRTP
jgi:hypothetical protein